MFLVLGNSATKIDLKDLGDVVYYKQQKTFSDSDYARSLDLQREIKSGRLLVLKQDQEAVPANSGQLPVRIYPVPKEVAPVPAPAPVLVPEPIIIEREVIVEKQVPSSDNNRLDLLLEKIIGLERRLNEAGGTDKETLLASFMDSVEAKLNNRPMAEPAPAAPKSDDDLNSKIDMLISIVQSGSFGGTQKSGVNVNDYTPKSVDEVYVPSIKVEDANAHINLKTRVIETGNQVSNALDALKALKMKK